MTEFRCKFCHKLLLKYETSNHCVWCGNDDMREIVVRVGNKISPQYLGEKLCDIEIKCPKCGQINKRYISDPFFDIPNKEKSRLYKEALRAS